jgi:hypothetical protein
MHGAAIDPSGGQFGARASWHIHSASPHFPIMTIVAKILVRLALYFVEHPDVIKEIVDAVHAAKPPQAKAA